MCSSTLSFAAEAAASSRCSPCFWLSPARAKPRSSSSCSRRWFSLLLARSSATMVSSSVRWAPTASVVLSCTLLEAASASDLTAETSWSSFCAKAATWPSKDSCRDACAFWMFSSAAATAFCSLSSTAATRDDNSALRELMSVSLFVWPAVAFSEALSAVALQASTFWLKSSVLTCSVCCRSAIFPAKSVWTRSTCARISACCSSTSCFTA
mmetsp:Transcript_75826/g.180101  ORF Transcript_75826/g.180101 Transcript_75826/m.180101 type:complete len:211 (-) Transcript_75826:13-645(-)